MQATPARAIAAAALMAWLAPAAFAQRATGSLNLPVQARAVSLRAGDEPKLHWVLTSPPGPQSIASLTDEGFRSELSSVLTALAARKGTGESQCLEIVVEERAVLPECSLRDTLRKTFAEPRKILLGDFAGGKFVSKPDPLKLKPAQAESAAGVRALGFTYEAGPGAVSAVIAGIRVRVETAWAQPEAGGAAAPLQRPIPLEAASLPPGLAPGAVAAAAVYSVKDKYPGAGPNKAELFTDDEVVRALAQVAAAALRAAQERQLLPGAVPDRTQLGALASQIEAEWGMNPGRTHWPAVSASVKPEADGTLAIQVSGMRLVREARISLKGTETAENKEDQARLDSLPQRAADKVQAEHAADLAVLRGTVPQLKSVMAVRQQLGQPKEAAAPFLVNSSEGAILYEAAFRYVISILEGKIEASLGTNPQEQFTAAGSVTGAKLFYLIPTIFGREAAGELGEAHSLTAKGGAKFQNIAYSLSRGIDLWGGTLLPGLDMDWKRDVSQRFGPALSAIPKEVGRGLRPGVSWEKVVSGDEAQAWSRSVKFDLGLPLRHTRILPNAAGAADLVDAQVTALRFSMRLGAGYDFRVRRKDDKKKGARLQAGGASVELRTESARAWQILGGDFTFWKHSVQGTAALPWGFTMPDQFLLRYVRGAGTGSAAMPLFELFRLGGGENLRGMEAGEFLGRSMSWEQAEFGYNLFEPLDLISKKLSKPKPGEEEKPDAPKGISGFLRQNGISTLLVKAAHDRALAGGRGRSLGDLFSLERAFTGWGVGLELGGLRTPAGNVSLTLMRAKSSASYAHRKGLWATGVNLAF